MTKFIFEKATDINTRQLTERSIRRKGSEVVIERVSLGLPLLIEYTDGSGTLMTSRVVAYNPDWKTANYVNVQTQNTVYLFRKVSE